jgi:hypothetical protein
VYFKQFSKDVISAAYVFKVDFIYAAQILETASVVWWSEFLATDPKVPGSISGATRFSEK